MFTEKWFWWSWRILRIWSASSKFTCQQSFDKAINNDIYPNKIIINDSPTTLNILIAGCGTGQQIINCQRYKNANITAIDLSLASLSYAKRMISKLGIENVSLFLRSVKNLDAF